MKRGDNNGGECVLARARDSMLQSSVDFCVATSWDSKVLQT